MRLKKLVDGRCSVERGAQAVVDAVLLVRARENQTHLRNRFRSTTRFFDQSDSQPHGVVMQYAKISTVAIYGPEKSVPNLGWYYN
jgi:hypothetical protein